MYCNNCKNEIIDSNLKFCTYCGRPITINRKNKLITLILVIFFGLLGLHRFYIKRYVTGLFMLFLFIITFCMALSNTNPTLIGLIALILFCWNIVDFILICISVLKPAKGGYYH